MRAVLTRDGPYALRADARMARDLFGPTHPLYAAAIFFEAVSHLFDGDHDAADPILAHGYDVAVYHHAMPVAVASSAFRAMIAIRREDWDDARAHAARAVAAVETGHLEDYLEAGIVYAVAGRVAAHDSDLPAATDAIARAARVRPLQTYGVPVTALIQLEMVRAYLQVADAVGARTVLREVVDTLRQRPDLGVVAAEVEELRGTLDAIRQGPVGASSLTAAELRLLPYLATHMSFREIGERLFVSRHTVKSQAISLYRKVGASSRSEALARADEIGLLGR
jgi:LuxR family maltose regulon positive regulatory protein